MSDQFAFPPSSLFRCFLLMRFDILCAVFSMALGATVTVEKKSGEFDPVVAVKVVDSVTDVPPPPSLKAKVKEVVDLSTGSLPVADDHRKISHQTFVGLSIANEEKLFFDNMHSAAQQLSLLGIKAVGLATQIQAIRGHIMMLRLIDEHIETLTKDHERYSVLLVQAHSELRKSTGV